MEGVLVSKQLGVEDHWDVVASLWKTRQMWLGWVTCAAAELRLEMRREQLASRLQIAPRNRLLLRLVLQVADRPSWQRSLYQLRVNVKYSGTF